MPAEQTNGHTAAAGGMSMIGPGIAFNVGVPAITRSEGQIHDGCSFRFHQAFHFVSRDAF
jgi:hypothetical protein